MVNSAPAVSNTNAMTQLNERYEQLCSKIKEGSCFNEDSSQLADEIIAAANVLYKGKTNNLGLSKVPLVKVVLSSFSRSLIGLKEANDLVNLALQASESGDSSEFSSIFEDKISQLKTMVTAKDAKAKANALQFGVMRYYGSQQTSYYIVLNTDVNEIAEAPYLYVESPTEASKFEFGIANAFASLLNSLRDEVGTQSYRYYVVQIVEIEAANSRDDDLWTIGKHRH